MSYPTLAADAPRPVRGPSIRSQQERRLNDFVGGQFGDYNLSSVLFEHRTDSKDYIKLSRWSPDIGKKPSFEEAKKQRYTECAKGDAFGPSWTNHWVKVELTVPKEWQQKEWVELEVSKSAVP